MRIVVILALSLAACRTSHLGACSSDSDCQSGRCDLSQQICVATKCTPACSGVQVCDSATITCVDDRDAPQITGIAITPAPDYGSVYNGAGSPLTVTAAISDAAGVDAATVCLRLTGETGACAHPGTAGAGGTWSFSLPRSATSDGSSPTDFTIFADDTLAAALTGSIKAEHQGKSDAQHVFFDNQPPTLSAPVKVYRDAEPSDAGVTYPAAVLNTGYTGSSFIYSDTVHVKGALADPVGIASALLHLDGLDLDGGTTAGNAQPLSLSCAGGSCAFAADVKLDDPANGAFHTGSRLFDTGVAQIPLGPLQIVIDAKDNLQHSRSFTTVLNATRLIWQAQLQNGPSGLAVHPGGDVIATTDGGTTSVYDIAPDGTVRWTVSAGPIIGGPAVGAGDGGSAPIYFATKGRSVYGVAADGGVLFRQDNLGIFTAAPAVASAGSFEQVIIPDISGAQKLWAVAQGRTPVSVNSDDIDGTSGPVVLDGGVYFGTSSGISRHDLPGDGTLGSPPSTYNIVGGPFYGLVTDGTSIYAAQRGAGTQIFQLDPQLNPGWFASVTNGVTAEPSVDAAGVLVSNFATGTTGGKLQRFNGSLTPTTLYTFDVGASGRVPVQGSGGHTYLTRTAALLIALKGTQLSWEFDAPGEPFRGAAMDCQGRLYIAGGSTAAGFWVWAFATDDRGLADTPWPSMRRDSRNTGNFGAPRYGIRTGSGCLQ